MDHTTTRRGTTTTTLCRVNRSFFTVYRVGYEHAVYRVKRNRFSAADRVNRENFTVSRFCRM